MGVEVGLHGAAVAGHAAPEGFEAGGGGGGGWGGEGFDDAVDLGRGEGVVIAQAHEGVVFTSPVSRSDAVEIARRLSNIWLALLRLILL